MREKQTHARFGFLMSALALMSTPSAVLAQETCTTDTDCEHGYTCEAIGGDCAAVDCAGDGCEAPPPCETTLGCVPVTDCSADSDCIDGWNCVTQTIESDCRPPAPTPTCDPADPDCVEADDEGFAPADCGEPREVSACIAPWLLPCVAADDCGAGFECVERISEWCNGSSGGSDPGEPTPGAGGAGGDGFAPPPDDGEPEDVAPPECGSEPTGEYYCQLLETTCSVDSDCAAGLTCQTFVGDGVCSGGSSDLPPSATPDGGAEERIAPPDCQQPEPTYACAPPSFQVSLDYGHGESRDDSASGSADPQPATDDESSGPSTGEEPPSAPVDGDGTTNGGTAVDDSAGDTMEESSGCNALGAHGNSGVFFMVLAVLGLAGRRRSLQR